MKQAFAITLTLILVICSVATFVESASADDWSFGPEWIFPDTGTVANVTFTVGDGGFLWVNGTVLSNQTISISNQTTLVLTASPSNANYAFDSYNVNGTTIDDNPKVYVIDVPDNSSVLAIDVLFEEVPVVTPSPVPDLTVDDAAGLAVVGMLLAFGGGCAVVLFMRFKPSEE